MIAMPGIPVLETERLILRGPEPGDWESYCAFWTSDRTDHVGGRRTRRDAWRGFASTWGHWAIHGFGTWIVTDRQDGKSLGLAALNFPDGYVEREIGWILWDGAEGRGIALEAATAARDHVFGTLGWKTAVSYIDPDNTRSIRLAEKLGARPDPDAAHSFGDEPCVVYRHPAPEALQ